MGGGVYLPGIGRVRGSHGRSSVLSRRGTHAARTGSTGHTGRARGAVRRCEALQGAACARHTRPVRRLSCTNWRAGRRAEGSLRAERRAPVYYSRRERLAERKAQLGDEAALAELKAEIVAAETDAEAEAGAEAGAEAEAEGEVLLRARTRLWLLNRDGVINQVLRSTVLL